VFELQEEFLARNLVIVESPSKARTIKKFLGRDFEVLASVGHIVDLPERGLGVDTRKDFAPKYVIVPGKEKILAELRRASRMAEEVYLAPDPDREGEAISWHLARALELKNPRRAVFNEITKSGVQRGIEQPREIDERLVNAQQARRVLDRLVGYKISPLLWRKVLRGTSAGRVQSVALRLICDREEQIRAFVPEEYWTITARLSRQNQRKLFEALLLRHKSQGEREKLSIKSETETQSILEHLRPAAWKVLTVETKKTRSQPPLPYTTSSMQQDASTRLRFAPKKTMRIAQELYEGVDLGGDSRTGLITYMRTDSVRISEEAQAAARQYIESEYGKEFVGAGRKVKEKGHVQGAHEAIRPTDIMRTPTSVKPYLSTDQFKLYDLIWRRFVASFMTPAVFNSTRILIEAGDYIFVATGSTLHFLGYYAIWPREEKDTVLPVLQEGDFLDLHELVPQQHFTEPPPRYTEASLIKELEELGIGRPSTYVPIISTLIERKYVRLEQRRFVPEWLGETVNELMKKHFPRIVDVRFTADVEAELDRIEEGSEEWTKVVRAFYDPFKATLEEAERAIRAVERPVEPIDDTCPECGRRLVIKHGRFGQFISCSGYPECKYSRQLSKKIGISCPLDGGDIIERTSRRGRIFYGCSNYPSCQWVSWDRPVSEPCPNCGGLVVLTGKDKSTLRCTQCGNERSQAITTISELEAAGEPLTVVEREAQGQTVMAVR
jgi:DNA topoisomerase-1